jgi:hypothetical protein
VKNPNLNVQAFLQADTPATTMVDSALSVHVIRIVRRIAHPAPRQEIFELLPPALSAQFYDSPACPSLTSNKWK